MSEVTTTNGALPTTIDEDAFIKAAMSNKGFTKDEGTIPFMRVMQPLSPQVGTIPGVTAGGFLNLATNKFEKELLVIPVDVRWNYTEWSAPQGEGGQFVMDWGSNESGWQEKCAGDQKFAYQPVTTDGHIILKARHFYLFSIDEIGDYERSIFPMYATALKIAKVWSTMLQYAPKVQTSRGMMTPAYFYYTYKLTLDEVKNTRNQRWFQPKVTANITDNKYQTVFDLPNGKAIWEAAVKLREDLDSGEAKATAQEGQGDDTY